MARRPAIGYQAKEWGKSVENTVATGHGAITTGQGKNVSGHFVLAVELTNYLNRLNSFDVVNTTARPYSRMPPPLPMSRPVHPTNMQTSMALMRYRPQFEAIVMSIDMGLPLDNINAGARPRKVRLQMFVRGPYAGLHRYVASVRDISLREDTSRDVGLAVNYDMAIGLLDPVSLYWRPPLMHAAYIFGYYSFILESAMIYNALMNWNREITLKYPPGAADLARAQREWWVNVRNVMSARFKWQQVAVNLGFAYPMPAWAPAWERNIPWQWPIVGRALENGIVREYPSL